uniref:Uncharacterized protein n=1 Tax=Onchocerca volvulus TaxID=6282 RepID=A0A8R1Y2F1_ONCVO
MICTICSTMIEEIQIVIMDPNVMIINKKNSGEAVLSKFAFLDVNGQLNERCYIPRQNHKMNKFFRRMRKGIKDEAQITSDNISLIFADPFSLLH